MFLFIFLSSLVITTTAWPVTINNTVAPKRGEGLLSEVSFVKWTVQAKLNMMLLKMLDADFDSSVSDRPLSHTGNDSMSRKTGMSRKTDMMRSSKRSRLAASITCYDQAGFQVIQESFALVSTISML